MTTPSDAMLLEMIAACEQLGEGYARSLRAVQQLTSAGFQGRGVSVAALQAYDEQAERARADIERFRTLVAQFKSQIRVH